MAFYVLQIFMTLYGRVISIHSIGLDSYCMFMFKTSYTCSILHSAELVHVQCSRLEAMWVWLHVRDGKFSRCKEKVFHMYNPGSLLINLLVICRIAKDSRNNSSSVLVPKKSTVSFKF